MDEYKTGGRDRRRRPARVLRDIVRADFDLCEPAPCRAIRLNIVGQHRAAGPELGCQPTSDRAGIRRRPRNTAALTRRDDHGGGSRVRISKPVSKAAKRESVSAPELLICAFSPINGSREFKRQIEVLGHKA
jgi:hypothetical protein